MAKSKKIKPGLGKGLEALIPSSVKFTDKGFDFEDAEGVPEDEDSVFKYIDVDKIKNNPYQPRRDFDDTALEDLKDSILEHGVIQPLSVSKAADGYSLISGERRLRASKLAGLEKVPAFILDVDSGAEMLEIALIENLQREDLNPIEIAHGYKRLIEECNLTQDQVAVKVSKDRSTVANSLRLLRLPEKIQESLRKKEISQGHARALLGVSDREAMTDIWRQTVEKNLSVRAVEKLARDYEQTKKKEKKKEKSPISEEEKVILASAERDLRQRYGTRVQIRPKSKESGSISFDFYSKDDLERLLDLFAKD